MDKCECANLYNADECGPYCSMCGGMVRSIDFPICQITNELVELCRDWHSGQTSAMYSVSSTGLIHNADILLGLESELREMIRLSCNLQNEYDEEKQNDKRIAQRWLPILERWEATLPESEE